MKNKRIESLDSLRGISAMIVIVFHCLISFNIFYNANYNGVYDNVFIQWFTESPLNILWAGNEAVLLFFILSGFVLTFPFQKGSYNNYWEFATKRFFRIYVPYIIIMFSSVLIMYMFMGMNTVNGLSSAYETRWDHGITLKSVISFIFMIGYDTANVNGVVWSLYHEMRISLIFPFLMFFLMKYKWIKSVPAALFLNLILTGFLYFVSSNAPIEIMGTLSKIAAETFYYLTYFIFGAGLALKREVVTNYFRKISWKIKFVLWLMSFSLIANKWMFTLIEFENSFIQEIVSGLGILLLFSLVLSSKSADKALTIEPLKFLGEISYSIYLVHIPVLMVTTIVLSKFIPVWITLIFVPILSIPVAWIAYKFIEKPAINWGKKVINVVKDRLKTERKLPKTLEKTNI
ncbi:acyltransferase family protein [Gracilibacillus dipsosauri]|uniref:acyltransferase family protein n=1 Tax=Gracilibacillus dipsosauri TaxID=178340 RepID=UPI002409FD29